MTKHGAIGIIGFHSLNFFQFLWVFSAAYSYTQHCLRRQVILSFTTQDGPCLYAIQTVTIDLYLSYLSSFNGILFPPSLLNPVQFVRPYTAISQLAPFLLSPFLPLILPLSLSMYPQLENKSSAFMSVHCYYLQHLGTLAIYTCALVLGFASFNVSKKFGLMCDSE